MTQPSAMTTLACSLLALFAFAANSVLCRLALGSGAIDPASFTIIRLCSGAAILAMLVIAGKGFKSKQVRGTLSGWLASVALFTYAVTFSYAYLELNTATGALVLFGMVQLTMTLTLIVKGQRPTLLELSGIAIAFAGLVYLMLPSAQQPSILGFILMSVAGVAWGAYTLLGKGSSDPTFDTALNFIRSVPFAIGLGLLTFSSFSVTTTGVLLAIASGALASGAGYAIWYYALRGLKVTQAAVIQLSVPVIAAVGGVLFVGERFTIELAVSMIMILGGISLVVFAPKKA